MKIIPAEATLQGVPRKRRNLLLTIGAALKNRFCLYAISIFSILFVWHWSAVQYGKYMPTPGMVFNELLRIAGEELAGEDLLGEVAHDDGHRRR